MKLSSSRLCQPARVSARPPFNATVVAYNLIFLATLVLVAALPSSAAEVDGATSSSGPELDEIVVTAEKRTENIQNVPIPVSVVDGQSLSDSNELRLQDYFTEVPGLTVFSGTGAENLIIRGVSTGLGNPTVAVTIDDVSYGSSTAYGGNYVPDIDPSEIQRVEVLRGPQGTLYGASSLGGLVKYVTVDPSTDGVSGHLEAGTSTVYNGAELGYNFRGAVNLPLSDTVAIRLSAFTRLDPGYVDNPVSRIDGVNESYTSGGHVAALWQPSNALSLKLSALVQYLHSDGLSDVDLPIDGYAGPPLTGLQQDYVRGAGAFFQKLQAYSATTKLKLGVAELTSITAFNVSHFLQSVDLTWAYASLTDSFYSVPGTVLYNNTDTQKFTQELRLETPLGEHVDWLLGAFLTHEGSPYIEYQNAVNGHTGAFVAQEIAFTEPQTYAEYSGFTDFTVHISDQWDLQLGGRETHIDQSMKEVDSGNLVPIFESPFTSPVLYPKVTREDQAFTYLVTPEFKLSKDLMIYARLASGYRPGGINETAAPYGLPLTFGPDKTQNWEVGIKGNTPNHIVTFDASIYYISWKDIQLYFLNAQGFTYFANGGRAKSEGIELSGQARPATGFTISGSVTYDDAELAQDLPSQATLYGVTGDRLPYSPRISANLSVRQEFPLTRTVSGFVGSNLSYVGDRFGNFENRVMSGAQTMRILYGPYAKLNLLAGANYEKWAIKLSATNVTDRRGVINGGEGNLLPPYAYIYIQPRTLYLSVSRQF